jgi:hypothetical protein
MEKTTSAQYVGGCIFVDHGSGYVNVQNQLGFSAVETIRAKQSFKQFFLGNGVIVQNYLTDSGAFKANKFVKVIKVINDTQQRLRFCGTNAHHKNGVAERSIQTVSNLARAMILHASMHWKDDVDASFWPMAVQYATHIYNNTPGDNGVCPTDIFTGGTVPRHCLRDVYVWGSPVCVLDPKLQQDQKLPRWQPRSCRGMFLGLSQIQVLNFSTGRITTQYHVVFDDLFTTVPSIEREHEPPSHWEELCLDESIHIPVDNETAFIHDDWITTEEQERKSRQEQRSDIIRDAQVSQYGVERQPETQTTARTERSNLSAADPPALNSQTGSNSHTTSVPFVPQPTPLPTATESNVPTHIPTIAPLPSPTIKSEGASAPVNTKGVQRSTRSNAGKSLGKRYAEEVFLACVCADDALPCESANDMNDGTLDQIDPRV